MRIPKLKKWQWFLLVLVALSIVGNLLPEQQPVEGAETTSPVVLLWIPVIVLPVYLVLRSRKKKKEAIKNWKKKQKKLQELLVTERDLEEWG